MMFPGVLRSLYTIVLIVVVGAFLLFTILFFKT